ncbi:hypothetical protein CASFOL_024772 [Castilleja foliolosa]|uniref:Tubby C-terminal domain-containing protein n=1 Tax=Castilleja foliolosa TaxID=1961234 RepID=A0ABD3CQ76_9LAMI
MVGVCKKTTISRQSSYNSLYRNPLIENKHHRDAGDKNSLNLGPHIRRNLALLSDNKENAEPNVKHGDSHSQMKGNLLKSTSSSSLQLCIKQNDPDSIIGLKLWSSVDSEKSNSGNVWDAYSDSETAPASSWSTLPNRSLMCRPLPLDVGRCTCIIVKESSPHGTLYTLYTNEGKGRENRKLAVAHHRRRRGRSEFTIAQNAKGIVTKSDDSLIGIVTSNIMGSKYHIWDQGRCLKPLTKHPKLLASVKFTPTVSTWTGTYRSIKAWIPKHQFMQLKNTNQIQHINGLPTEWEEHRDRVHQLFSKVPSYNKFSKQYELDFRCRGRAGLKIQSSVKNFQLTLEPKADNPSTRKAGKVQVCDGLQISIDGLSSFRHVSGFD